MSTVHSLLVVTLTPFVSSAQLFAVERWPRLLKSVSSPSLADPRLNLERLVRHFSTAKIRELVVVSSEKQFMDRLDGVKLQWIKPVQAWQKTQELISSESKLRGVRVGWGNMLWSKGQFGQGGVSQMGVGLASFGADLVGSAAFLKELQTIFPKQASWLEDLLASKRIFPRIVAQNKIEKELQAWVLSFLLRKGKDTPVKRSEARGSEGADWPGLAHGLENNHLPPTSKRLQSAETPQKKKTTESMVPGLTAGVPDITSLTEFDSQSFLLSFGPDLSFGDPALSLFSILNGIDLPTLTDIYLDDSDLALALGAIFSFQPAYFYQRSDLLERYFVRLASILTLKHEEDTGSVLGELTIDLGLREILKVQLVSGELVRLPQKEFDQGQLSFDLKGKNYFADLKPFLTKSLAGGYLGVVVDLRRKPLWQGDPEEIRAKFESLRKVLN